MMSGNHEDPFDLPEEAPIPDIQTEVVVDEDGQESQASGTTATDDGLSSHKKSANGGNETAEDLGIVLRSGRSSKRKIDPDFFYDSSMDGSASRRAKGSSQKALSTVKNRSASDLKQKNSTDTDLPHNERRKSADSRKKSSKNSESGQTGTESKSGSMKESGNDQKAEGAETDSLESDDEDDDEDTRLYCICRKPHNNRFMISCDKCEEWFHGGCVGVTQAQGKELDRKNLPWICPPCRTEPTTKEAPATPTSTEVKARSLTPETSEEREFGPPAAEAEKPAPQTPTASAVIRKTETSAKKADGGKSNQRSLMRIKPKKQSQPKPKEEKAPELPAEAANKDLELTALGRPQASALRTIRPSRPADSRTGVQRSNSVNQPQESTHSGSGAASVFFGQSKNVPAVTSPRPSVSHVPASPAISSASSTPAVESPHAVKKKAHNVPRGLCYVCRNMARENSLYCSSKCILRHGTEILEILDQTPGAPDHVPVTDKFTGKCLKGEEAPTRTSLLAFLESHQTYYVPIRPEVREAHQKKKAEMAEEEDPVRTSSRLMLKDHLTKRYKEASDLQERYQLEDIAKVAADMEAGLFKHFVDANQKYKQKYRTLVMNISDKKNDNFFRRLIQREIDLDKVGELTADDMASDKLVKWRQEELKKELEMIIKDQPEEPEPQRNDLVQKSADEVVLTSEDPLRDDDETESLIQGPLTDPEAASSSRPSHSPEPVEKDDAAWHRPTSPGTPKDTTPFHDDHIFDANCRICTESLSNSAYEPTPLAKTEPVKREVTLPQKPKQEPAHYDSPSYAAGFKYPKQIVNKRVKIENSPSEESPTSSLSDSSPPEANVIWQGELHTTELPVVKLQASAVYGKATDFMKELPNKLHQMGRLQPQQLWPYFEQVKPLKDIAIVSFRSPGQRPSNEFNSLHYFLTTRGRVSVLGPLPSTFKDFYIIALREKEPLPDQLRDLPNCDLEPDHPKILIGIIVHHRSQPYHSSSRPLSESRTSTPGKSPVDSPVQRSPMTGILDVKPPTSVSVDPIVSKYLGLVSGAKEEKPESTNKSPDTSEPMEIEDEDSKPEVTAAVTAAPKEVRMPSFRVPPPEQPKSDEKETKETAASTTPIASQAAALDPRLARFQAKAAESGPIEASKPAPQSVPVAAPASDASKSAPSEGSKESVSAEDSDGFGFSNKFIENLHKINLPPGLKEALQSISAPKPQQPGAAGPLQGTTSVRPQYQLPPPGYGANVYQAGVNINQPPPLPGAFLGHRPAPQPYQPDRHAPYYSEPPANNPYGDRPSGPPRGSGWQQGERPPPNRDRYDNRPFARDDHRPPFDRDGGPGQRNRPRNDDIRRNRDGRWNRDDKRDRDDRRPQWNRPNDRRRRTRTRSPSPIRARSRSPVARKVSEEKSSAAKEVQEGVDEFGRDISLRYALKKTSDTVASSSQNAEK